MRGTGVGVVWRGRVVGLVAISCFTRLAGRLGVIRVGVLVSIGHTGRLRAGHVVFFVNISERLARTGTAFSGRRVLFLNFGRASAIASLRALVVVAILGWVFVLTGALALDFLELLVETLGARGAVAQLVLALQAAKEILGQAGNGQDGL